MMEYADSLVANHSMLAYGAAYSLLGLLAIDVPNFLTRLGSFERLKTNNGDRENLAEIYLLDDIGTVGRHLFPEFRKADDSLERGWEFLSKVASTLPGFTRAYNRSMKNYLKDKKIGDEDALRVMKRVYGGKAV